MPALAKTNMRVLLASRSKVHVGDIFVYQMPDDLFGYGRVVATDANVFAPGGILLYLYRYRSVAAEAPPRSELKVHTGGLRPVPAALGHLFPTERNVPTKGRVEWQCDNLLIPPLVTNRLPWSYGYFRTIAPREPFEDHERLPVHSFYHRGRGWFDEHGSPQAAPGRVQSLRALSSYRTIDDELSVALGFEPVED